MRLKLRLRLPTADGRSSLQARAASQKAVVGAINWSCWKLSNWLLLPDLYGTWVEGKSVGVNGCIRNIVFQLVVDRKLKYDDAFYAKRTAKYLNILTAVVSPSSMLVVDRKLKYDDAFGEKWKARWKGNLYLTIIAINYIGLLHLITAVCDLVPGSTNIAPGRLQYVGLWLSHDRALNFLFRQAVCGPDFRSVGLVN